MTPLFAAGLTMVLGLTAAIESAQQTPPTTTDLLAAHPFCRHKASSPEPLVPDPRFDVAHGTKLADTAPVLSRSTVVRYPTAAMASGICGTVVLQLLLKADGKVGGARVLESLDKVYGLDADAVKTVNGWQFKPGRVNGKAVATVITARVEYVLDAVLMDPFQAADNIGRFARICGYLLPVAAGKADAGMLRFEFSADKKSLVVRIPEAAKDVQAKVSIPQSAACVIGPIGNADGRPYINVARADRLIMDPTGVPFTDVANFKDPGIIKPKILKQLNPKYTPEAMRHKIAGQVEMDAVVMTDGTVGYVRVVRSVDAVYGLDDEAIATARRWRFAPATKDGRPIACRVGILMVFRLH